MNAASWSAGMGWVGRLALALVLLASCGAGAHAAEPIVVVFSVEDAGEVISSDLKRMRLAEPAEVRFAVITPYIARVFGDDLTLPRTLMRFTVLASARRVLGELSAAEALKPEAVRAVVADIDRALDYVGVSVESHTLRYMLVPPLAVDGTPGR
jgi:hypothetical protein